MEHDAPVVVTRWKRFGKDRLYVSLPRAADEDVRIGWWDLVTDEPHPEGPEHVQLLVETVAGWYADQQRVAVPHPRREPEPAEVAAAPATTPWVDLTLNKPGASARDRALTERAEAPVRTTLARLIGVHTAERAWRIGADGKELVAAQLAKVARKDPRWRALHAIPVGRRGADIDHLVIGPGGVFTVNAKHHPGARVWVGGNTMLVDGNKTTYIRNARHEAGRAARLLTDACGAAVDVHGVVVTVNAKDVVVKSQPAGVSVTWRKNLSRWLLTHGEILDAATIERVHEAARRSTTWSR
jgi:hypothetical protein